MRHAAGLLVLTQLAAVGHPGEGSGGPPPDAYLRVSQAGFAPDDVKTAVVLARQPMTAAFEVRDESGRRVLAGRARSAPPLGEFTHHYALDLTPVTAAGRYAVRLAKGGASGRFVVAAQPFAGHPDVLLEFLRQQRCGYNPFLDAVCHAYDGRSAYGPLPPGSYVDARGGWHDAADQLKYLLTSSTATAHLLAAHRAAPGIFADRVDALGRLGPNGLADVLDEARWGLEWMLRLHPAADQLYHQVADDRDHIGWKLPAGDTADYGWGPGKERVVYFADGRPQGLSRYRSESNGLANLAGRYAAAMGLAYETWKDDAMRRPFAQACLTAGIEVYRLGRARRACYRATRTTSRIAMPRTRGRTTWNGERPCSLARRVRRSTGTTRSVTRA